MPPATIARQAALKNSSRSLAHPPIFFSAPPQPLEHPGNRGVADLHTSRPLQEFASLWQRRRRSLPQVRFQQLSRHSVQLGLGSGTLFRSERSSLACGGGVALDARGAYAEGFSDFGGRHASFLGLNDLLSEVQRVGIHDHILSRRPTTLQDALVAMMPPPEVRRKLPRTPFSRQLGE